MRKEKSQEFSYVYAVEKARSLMVGTWRGMMIYCPLRRSKKQRLCFHSPKAYPARDMCRARSNLCIGDAEEMHKMETRRDTGMHAILDNWGSTTIIYKAICNAQIFQSKIRTRQIIS